MGVPYVLGGADRFVAVSSLKRFLESVGSCYEWLANRVVLVSADVEIRSNKDCMVFGMGFWPSCSCPS